LLPVPMGTVVFSKTEGDVAASRSPRPRGRQPPRQRNQQDDVLPSLHP
jgi:hypothetical protein